MSIESVPSRYKEPYDSLDQVYRDYETIALYTAGRVFSGDGVSKELESIYRHNRVLAPNLIDRLLQRGVYLEPVDDEICVIDQEHIKTRIFAMAASLALQVADNFARENSIDQQKWREFWANLPDRADAICEIQSGKKLTSEDCHAVGEALLGRGQRYISQMDNSYAELVSRVINEYPEISEDANVFRGSFGYVMGNAERIINTLISERRIDEDVAMATKTYTNSTFDDKFKQFLRIARRLDE